MTSPEPFTFIAYWTILGGTVLFCAAYMIAERLRG